MPLEAEVGLGLLRHVARVAAVGLTRDRVVDEEVDVQRLVRAERVDERAVGVGQQQHVRLVDRLEAADRRAVEAQAVGERVLAERRRRDGEVLHDAGQVAEADVDELDVVVADVGGDLVGTGEHRSSGSGRTARDASYERGVAPGCPECFGGVTSPSGVSSGARTPSVGPHPGARFGGPRPTLTAWRADVRPPSQDRRPRRRAGAARPTARGRWPGFGTAGRRVPRRRRGGPRWSPVSSPRRSCRATGACSPSR